MANEWWESAPVVSENKDWWADAPVVEAKTKVAPVAQAPVEKTRTWGQAAQDTGVQLAEGVNTIAGAIPSLVSPEGSVAKFFNENADYWRSRQSEPLLEKEKVASAAISKAGEDGVLSQIGEAASQYFNDPALAARFITTNLPSMIPGIGAAKVAQVSALAKGATAAKAASIAGTASGGMNAVLNAGGARGDAFEDIKKTLIAQGMTPEQAEEQAIKDSRIVAAIGGIAGFVSGKTGLEKSILSGSGGVKAGLASAAKELGGEQLEELAPKFATNVQAAQYDSRDITKDIGRTAVETAIGAGPGAVVSGFFEARSTSDNVAAADAALAVKPDQARADEADRLSRIQNVETIKAIGDAPDMDAAIKAATQTLDATSESIKAVDNIANILGATNAIPTGDTTGGGRGMAIPTTGVETGNGVDGQGISVDTGSAATELVADNLPLERPTNTALEGERARLMMGRIQQLEGENVQDVQVPTGAEAQASPTQEAEAAPTQTAELPGAGDAQVQPAGIAETQKAPKNSGASSTLTVQPDQRLTPLSQRKELPNAIEQSANQASISAKRESGTESRQAAKASSSDSLQRTATSTAQEEVNQRLIPKSQRTESSIQHMDSAGAAIETVAPEGELSVKAEPQQVETLGRDGVPISQGGKPFKTQKAAKEARKLQPAMRVISTDGGFVLSPKTEKQLAAEAKAAKRLAQPNTSQSGQPIPAHSFIASEGGLSKAAQADLGVGDNPKIGNRRLFAANGGLSIEQATQSLIERGYLPQGASNNQALELIKRSLTNPQYTPEGVEQLAQQEQSARFEDYLSAEQDASLADDFDPFQSVAELGYELDDAVNAGYDAAADAIKVEVNALLALAESQGIDIDAIQERAANDTYKGSEQDYYETAKRYIQEAIEGSNRDSGTNVSGEAETLTAPTRSEVLAKQEREAESVSKEKAQKRADDLAAQKEQERKEIAKASEAAAESFELGGDAMENLTGQKPMFSRKATETLDAAGITGKERVDAMIAINRGDITPEQLEAAYPAKNPQTETAEEKQETKSAKAPAPSTPIATIREAIKQAYGNLLSQLEKRGLTTITQTQEEAITAAAQARADKNGGDVQEIKKSLMSMAGMDVKYSTNGDIQGFYDPESGKSFLIADNLTAETAPAVLMHEVGIHAANDGSLDAVFKRATNILKAGKGNAFIDNVNRRMKDAGETSGEEAAAYITEAYEADRLNAPKSIVQFIKDFAAAIRAWAFKRGIIIKADDLSIADIAAIARANAKALANEPFSKFFAGSKVVDKRGKPLVVYHGTASDITKFDPNKTTSVKGIFFTPDADYASALAEASTTGSPNVMPVYVSLKNPVILTAEKYNLDSLNAALKTDADGVIALNKDGDIDVVVAKYPTQIKSATGNNGDYDVTNPDIRRSSPLNISRGLDAFSKADELFALPKSESKDLKQIAKDNGEEVSIRTTSFGNEKMHTLTFSDGTEIRISDRKANPYGQENQVYAFDLVDGTAVPTQVGRVGENPEDVPPTDDVWLDVSKNTPGNLGSIAYNIAATYAHNNGKIFVGDPAGLSDKALRRRTEQMLSSALKFGTTEHLAPHPRQVEGDSKLGVPPLKWIYGDDIGNIERMIDVSLKGLETAGVPNDLRYDQSTGEFRGKDGQVVQRFTTMGRSRERYAAGVAEAQAGWRTLARAAFLRSFLGPNGRAEGSGILDRASNDAARLANNKATGAPYPATERLFYSKKVDEFDAGNIKVANKKSPVAWRDVTGRLQFAPGQSLYNLIGDAAGPLLTKLQLKAASPELRKIMRQMNLEIEKATETATAIAGEANKLSEAERAMVSDIVEKEVAAGVVPPEHAIRLAAVINQTMGAQTDELIRLGMLSKESAERLRDKYLPRFYESKLKDKVENVWADSIGRMFMPASAMKGVRGKHLKGRGLYETIPESQLASYEAMGWEVRDPDYNPSVPSVDGKVQVWRDFTRQERDKMGEIRDVAFRMVMGYMQTQKDIALGRVFEGIANNPDMSSRFETEEHGVQVPESKVAGTGANTYGKLAGRWVSKDTFSQLSKTGEAENGALMMYRKAMGKWKEAKTVLNPVSHANNIISNITMAHLAGVSYWRPDTYIGAIRDLVKNNESVKEAKEAGLFLGSMSQEELMINMPDELKALAQKQAGTAEKIGKTVWDLMTFWLSKPMGVAYGAEDTFFRYLIYKDARDRGTSPNDAVDYAQKYIFTYDDLPKGARMIRDYGIPFFAYTYKAIPALLHTALTHPVRMAAPAAVLWAVNAAAYAIAAGDDDDSWERKLKKYITDADYRKEVKEKEKLERSLLPDWNKGTTSLLTPKVVRLGNDELTNLPMFLDMSRMIPGGDLFDVSPNAGGIPLPQPITPSHPLFSLSVGLLANKDMFLGKDLTDMNDTSAEKIAKRSNWVWKQLSPAIAINNYHWERTMNALAQANGGELKYVPDVIGGEATGIGRDGLPVQPKYAAMQTFGIKARPMDLEAAESIQQGLKKKLINDIDTELRKFKRLYSKGAIPERVLEAEREKAQLKKDRLREGLTIEGEAKD